MHPAMLDPDQLLQQCEVTRTRRSGPGGQHRNKVATAVVLKHMPTEIRAEANERRSQNENLVQALFRLRVNLALEVRTEPEAAASSLWTSRTRGGRISVNPEHQDFPALLAEALDIIGQQPGDVAHAAHHLGVTTTQLVRFLEVEPRAMHRVNADRTVRGMRPFR